MLSREMFQRLHAEPEPPEEVDQDEPVEEEQLTDEQFLRQLRSDVEGVKAGFVPAGSEDAHPAPKDRPWSPRRKRRDRYGHAF
jgi:hypothetical protein